MDEIRLENYRCFREEQNVSLAPLTLLVGENSTGKTSFLAIMRILWDISHTFQYPNFKEAPYDLGSFDEIAHHRGGKGGRAEKFEAGAKYGSGPGTSFDFTFGREGTTPVPIEWCISQGKNWIHETITAEKSYRLRVGTARGSWEIQTSESDEIDRGIINGLTFFDNQMTVRFLISYGSEEKFIQQKKTPPISSEDRALLSELARSNMLRNQQRTFAGAPVRSKPQRIYAPGRITTDPDGEYVPMYLADISTKEQAWVTLRKKLEKFGQAAGLFDEISIKRHGNKASEPFHIQVRKFGGGLLGPKRNLIDVGYGVSQVLPIITEMLRPDAPPLFLLQQPEVHLHPMAQAALGSLFCEVARPRRKIVVETHSDHLMDRIRMDIRDGVGNLKPDDVSILYFERNGIDVKIHAIRIDEEGNILDAPDGYRNFFMEETKRNLRL